MINVVAALIKKNNKILIAKRLTGDQKLIGKWEFPGGKVNDNELEINALEREIFEEFNIKVFVGKFIVSNTHKYTTKTIDLRLYECKYVSGKFKLNDHSEYVWINTKDLLKYDLAEADVPLAEYVKEMK